MSFTSRFHVTHEREKKRDYWNVENFKDAINDDNGYEWKLPKDI